MADRVAPELSQEKIESFISNWVEGVESHPLLPNQYSYVKLQVTRQESGEFSYTSEYVFAADDWVPPKCSFPHVPDRTEKT